MRQHIIIGYGLIFIAVAIMASWITGTNMLAWAGNGAAPYTSFETVQNMGGAVANPFSWFNAIFNIGTLWFGGVLWSGNWRFLYVIVQIISLGFWWEIGILVIPLLSNAVGKILGSLGSILGLGGRL